MVEGSLPGALFFGTTLMEMHDTPYDIAARQCALLGPEHIVIQDNVWLRHCRQLHGNERIFAVFNRISGRFSLAVWVWSPAEASQPLFIELDNFETTPLQEWPCDLTPPNMMRHRLKPLKGDMQKPYRKMLRERNYRRQHAETERKYMLADKEKYWIGKGRLDIAAKIRAGQLDYSTPTDQTREMTDRIMAELRRT